ncbi:MAG: hypothetical protein US31_C0021G0011 [Berkelbacteria bacterium GW2011_GWA1_36_9]|uniref:Uncharacterized protein n=1 Tax=Berkelbacteria bacterium GW2011_GWA1_36_9 TaxID=1618331 RepID=A0A0G0IMF4_9BACT|nr:MAG: hypothetical protein US31_C0021G0011 [Berkelbacteria bacterium GW2011_GWA1_36_9]
MSEKLLGRRSVAKIESILNKSNLPSGPRVMVLGYLNALKNSKDSTLEEIHEDSLSKLIPGDDFDIYVDLFNQSFQFIKNNAEELGVNPKRLK